MAEPLTVDQHNQTLQQGDREHDNARRGALSFMAGGGEMGERMRRHDWAASPLGDPQTWPQSLRTSVSTCLSCAFPILLWWGPELVMLYNDEYAPILGEKHPWALGQPGALCWAELWDVIGPMLRQVFAGGEPTRSRDMLLLPLRNGFCEESYFSFSYSPIRDETGGIGGIFTPVMETTAKVIGERRLKTLRDLAAHTAETLDVGATLVRSAAVLGTNPHDLPFAALYLLAADCSHATRVAHTGLLENSTICPLTISSSASASASDEIPWLENFRKAEAGTENVAENLAGWIARENLPCNPWPEPPAQMFFMPVTPAGRDRPEAVLVAGLSPRLAFDAAYREFFALAAGQIGTALADAMAFEEARRRAEELAKLDQAKTAFFANVSHEFRTPLTLLLGPLEELLCDPTLLPPTRERTEQAHRNALRLLRLVNDLLDFSRLEAGRTQARFEPTDFSTLTADLASNFRSLCDAAGLWLRVECPALPAPVKLDRGMWEKIVLNLLSNAFKFTHAGGITIATELAADGAQAVLHMEDTGIGIPQAEMPHVFERFHRVEGALGRTHEGAGIGLALVREMVQLHGGDVSVRSTPGRGTAFSVRIPVAQPEGEQPNPLKRGESAQRAAAYRAEASRWLPQNGIPEPDDGRAPAYGMRVLVADDNADMRAYLRRLLSPHYHVELAANGAEALAACLRSPPDLILSDVMMPVLDGISLVSKLRASPDTHLIPIILLSARAGPEAGADGLAAGADDYLVKPFAEQELLARVGSALRAAAARAEAGALERQLRAEAEQANARLRQLNCSLEAEVAARIAERDRIWRLSLELLVVLDFDGVIRSANPAWEKVLGYPPQELSGQNVATFIHPEDYLRTRGKLKSLRTASLPHTENRYRHRDGSWRWIAWTATAEDDLIYAVGRDITAEKHQAGMLAKTEEALRQAQKMEAVGQLTGGIAHDFNNLLQGISGGIELMHRRIADGRAHEAERFIETARKNIDRAAALTYRLLAFSRRQALSPRLVELDALIGGMGALIRQTVGPAITFEMRLMDGCWPICCDANQLENALLNLAINARDAMPDGGTLVMKTAHVVLSAADIAGVSGACPGEHVAITVTDTGTGMQDDVLRHAFEPFYTTKPAGQGTGLGLSQVYGFVTQSNGVVRLESEPGRGTSVHLYLPRHREKPLESEDPPSAVAAASGRGLAGAVIVLVEDEADLRAQACAALRECGCRVIEAADGPSGLNALRDALRLEADGIDMLVSDVGLPGGLNGRQLADAARALLPTLPVLLMTGYTGSLDATLPPGMAYLQKPFSLKNLAAAIETTIGGFA